MTYSYSGDPGASSKDAVRFATGDVDLSDQQLSDEEIAYLLVQRGDVLNAAVAACHRLAAKYSRLVSRAVGDLRIEHQQRRQAYMELARTLRAEGAIGGIVPYAGGISLADKETDEDDTDRVQPFFTRELGRTTVYSQETE